jgi:hypothetical protein
MEEPASMPQGFNAGRGAAAKEGSQEVKHLYRFNERGV